MKQGKAFIGKDGFWHKVFGGKEYILTDQFHYRNTAVKEAKGYKENGKTVKVAKAPGQLYGIWMLPLNDNLIFGGVSTGTEGVSKPKRRDIRLAPALEKEETYEEIHKLYKSGVRVSIKEHLSGFPAITVDCGEIHILTDCLSLEEWWRKIKEAGRS